MNIIETLFLGLVQGLTEFLPVSSSGHLVLFQNILNIKEEMVFFDVMVHFGTLLALLIFFRRDIAGLLQAVAGRDVVSDDSWSGTATDGRKFALWIIIGTLPAGIAFLLFKDQFEAALGSASIAGVDLLITGVFLFLADRVKKTNRKAASLGLAGALIVGTAQAFAIMPGISRSGATICAALFLGVDRKEAARFSFILAVPVILAGSVFELTSMLSAGIENAVPVLAGAIMAFVSGLIALKWLISVLTRGRLTWFAIYCWALGTVSILGSLFLF